MRAVGVVSGMVVVLAVTPALAQPAQPAAGANSSSWRDALKAALAFGHAEGKAAALARFTVPSAPMSKRGTEAELDQLDRLASEAREAYAAVKRHGSPSWTLAGEVRIGDMFACQVEKMRALPWSTGMGAPPARELVDGLLEPLRDQARRSWERAAADKEAARYWSGLAASAGSD